MPECMQDIGRKQNPINFNPDWSEVKTPDQMEKLYANFKWKGCGWYTEKNGDTILVVPADHVGNLFRFNVWNGRNPADDFNKIVNMPTRVDNR